MAAASKCATTPDACSCGIPFLACSPLRRANRVHHCGRHLRLAPARSRQLLRALMMMVITMTEVSQTGSTKPVVNKLGKEAT